MTNETFADRLKRIQCEDVRTYAEFCAARASAVAKFRCAQCGEHIEDDTIVWSDAVTDMGRHVQAPQFGQFWSIASTRPRSVNDLPYHPRCFQHAFDADTHLHA